MPTSDWKPTKLENPDFKCSKCNSNEVQYSIYESSDGAHEDIHYRCNNCNRDWWIEGPDY